MTPKAPATNGARLADRRVQRTHQTLGEALVALMLERGWDNVSVRDVCERANVGRSTFYTHFADKEELLVQGFVQLRRALHQSAAAPGLVKAKRAGPPHPLPSEPPPLAFVHGLIAHVAENLRVAQASLGTGGGSFVQVQFRDMLLDAFRDDLAGVLPAGPARDGATHFLAGALFEMLAWWVAPSRRTHDPDELEQSFLRLARPVIAALRRAGEAPRVSPRGTP